MCTSLALYKYIDVHAVWCGGSSSRWTSHLTRGWLSSKMAKQIRTYTNTNIAVSSITSENVASERLNQRNQQYMTMCYWFCKSVSFSLCVIYLFLLRYFFPSVLHIIFLLRCFFRFSFFSTAFALPPPRIFYGVVIFILTHFHCYSLHT